MTQAQLGENIGTIAVFALAVGLAHIALHARSYQRLGREALLCASAFVFCQAVIRTLSINHLIAPETARSVVAISAVAALAVLAQLGWLRHLDSRLQDKEHRR